MAEKIYLNFDLSFLDKKPKSAINRKSKLSFSERSKTNWVMYAVVGIIAIFVLNNLVSNNSSNIKTRYKDQSDKSSYGDDLVTIGDYKCSRYHANKASELVPSKTILSDLSSRRTLLMSKSERLEEMKTDLTRNKPSSYADQYTIDRYNEKINEYNQLLKQLQSDQDSLDNDAAYYTSKFKNYLDTYCKLGSL